VRKIAAPMYEAESCNVVLEVQAKMAEIIAELEQKHKDATGAKC
jgi:hypothetical protein